MAGNFRPPPERTTDVPDAGARIEELLARFKPDLVMLHSIGGRDADEVIRLAERRKIPVLLQLHFANDRYRHFAIRCQVARAAGISGVSDLNVPPYLRGRFTNLLTGLDLSDFEPQSVGQEIHADALPTVLLPARIVPSKGHADLVKAAALLRDRGVQFRMVFPGRSDDPVFESELRSFIHKKMLDELITFPGLLSQETMRKTYASCAVLAFPSYHHEGLPRVILEAQAMQLPVVTYDSGGSAAALLDGVSGFVVQTGNVIALADRLEELLQDVDHRRQMGEAGRRYVEDRFSLQSLAERHEHFYRAVLEAVGRSCPR
jgi:glycosyltransferase involved in cell wall biosynthesis